MQGRFHTKPDDPALTLEREKMPQDADETAMNCQPAAGCTYEYGYVSTLAPKFGWLLSMVLIKFLTIQQDKKAQEHIVEEIHQYRSTCYEIWL